MKHLGSLAIGLCLLSPALPALNAQEPASGATPPPKVLLLQREFLKPGKNAAHRKTESAFVTAMANAKWPVHYFAMTSLSGAPRVLFFTGYNSFADAQKDSDSAEKNTSFSAAMDHAYSADGEFIASADNSLLGYREDLSLRPGVDIAHMRYFEISRFVARPGHVKEFEELAKLYASGYEKIPDAHWATFESTYGVDNGGVYIVITPMKSMSEIDTSMSQSKQMSDALGEDGMKKLKDLTESSVLSTQTNLFAFAPSMSYPDESWVKADPAFWKPKPTAATNKPEAKPAQ